jgi:hypothetical protein
MLNSINKYHISFVLLGFNKNTDILLQGSKLKFCATDNSGHCKLWDIDGNIATPEHLRSNITEKNPWTGSIYSTSSQQTAYSSSKLKVLLYDIC